MNCSVFFKNVFHFLNEESPVHNVGTGDFLLFEHFEFMFIFLVNAA